MCEIDKYISIFSKFYNFTLLPKSLNNLALPLHIRVYITPPFPVVGIKFKFIYF